MARLLLIALALTAGLLAASPVVAQWGTIFGNDPPRPPGNVPDRPPMDLDRGPPPGGLPPGPPPRSRIQTEPLPPPPGVATAPPAATRPQDTPPRAPAQGTRPSRGTPQPASAPAPNDEVVITPPAVKIANPTAVFSGLDKITGRIITFEVALDETVRFGALEVTPRACYTRPPTENANTDGFVEVDELTLQGELRRIFTGWMFAASPGLNAVEHPIYDVWLIDCKGGAQPTLTAETAPEPAPQSRPPTRAQPPRRATQQLPPPPRR
jgi:hypothetical protein